MKNLITLRFASIIIVFLQLLTPLYTLAQTPGFPEEGDPGQAPISDYWWVLALIGIYFIYKKYQVLQKH